MRIAMIIFVGILSYLVVVIPGYYFIVPESTVKIPYISTSTDLPMVDAAKTSSKLSVANPGDAPPL